MGTRGVSIYVRVDNGAKPFYVACVRRPRNYGNGMFFMLPHYVRCACAMRPEQRRPAGYIEYIQYMVSGAR